MYRSTPSGPPSALGADLGMRQRLDRHPSLTPIRTADTLPTPQPRRRTARDSKDVKGKKRAFGWGMGRQAEWVEEGFRRFGEHCARNQIRTLLIDCLVMTNLFYPSMAIYLSKRYPPPSADSPFAQPHAGPSRIAAHREHPLGILTTRLLDSFFPYPPPLLPRLRWTGWWDDTPGTEAETGVWNLERPGQDTMDWLEEEIRVMRIAWTDVGGVLDGMDAVVERVWTERDQTILTRLRSIAESWEGDEINPKQRCIRQPAPNPTIDPGDCLIYSPYGIHSTGIRRIRLPNDRYRRDRDIYQGVALPFYVPRGSELDFERRWAQEMNALAEQVQGEAFEEASAVGRSMDVNGSWLLSFRTSSEPGPSSLPDIEPTLSPSPPKLVYVLYLALFSALGHQLSTASKVHSRFGLAFTGCVQLCCSSVMSFSILALLGWNGWGVSVEPTTLPTYILPFVITVVGAENMSTLTRAVFSVPFTYSVPVRIGLALSKVGISISIASLADLVVLGLVWFVVNIRPVREFCVFAAVLIVTDWFMLHTFFLTILSIDAQRLELADVLASAKGSATPATINQKQQAGDASPAKRGWKKIIQARTAKSGSLIAILCCVGIIYYLTERHRLPSTAATLYGYDPAAVTTKLPRPTPTPHVPDVMSASHSLTDAETVWRAINPVNWPSILVALPPASILILPQADHAMAPSALRALAGNRPRSPYPRIKPLLHAIKVLILPQAVTALALYSLLLYLLKDKQLLDAQRDKLGRGESSEHQPVFGVRERSPLSERLKAHLLPCTVASDVEILATSLDGRLVVSVSLDDSVHLWRFDDTSPGGGHREQLEVGSNAAGDWIVAAGISRDSVWVALAYRKGRIQIWQTGSDAAARLYETRQLGSSVGLMDIVFQPVDAEAADPFVVSRNPASSPAVPAVLVLDSAGSLVLSDMSGEVRMIPAREDPRGRSHLIRPSDGKSIRVLVDDSGGTDLWSQASSGWQTTRLHRTEALGRVTSATLYDLDRGDLGILIAVGYSSGLVEVFNASGDLMIALQYEEPITAVHIALPRKNTCTTCLAELPDGFYLTAITAQQTHFDLIHPRSNAGLCRCSVVARRSASTDNLQAHTASPSIHRPRSQSLIIPPSPARRVTPGSSPMRSPSLLPPVSNGEFPLSSHGTRRYSNLHRDDVDRNGTASDPASWADLDSTSLGAISTSGGGSILIGHRMLALHRAGADVGDASWLVLSVDLEACWNGSTLVVESANFASVARRTSNERVMAESSMRARRTERFLSLGGRVSFPSLRGSGRNSTASSAAISGAGSPALAYVSVRPLVRIGNRGLAGGFGNRLGVITVDEGKDAVDKTASGSSREKPGRLLAANGSRKVSPTTPGILTAGSSGPAFLAPPPAAVSSSKKSM